MGTEKQSQTASTPSHSPLSAPAHTLPYASVLQELSVNSEEGLSTQEAKSRLQKWGPNELEGDEGISLAKIIIRQVANAMMLVSFPIFTIMPSHLANMIYYSGPHHRHGRQFRH